MIGTGVGDDAVKRCEGEQCMKLITAVIKPFKVDEVRQAVADLGIQGLTVTEVQGYGRQNEHGDFHHGSDARLDFLPTAKIELAVDDSIAEQVFATWRERENRVTARFGYLNSNRPSEFGPAKPVPTRFDAGDPPAR